MSATLVVISPQSPSHNQRLISGRRLRYEVLCDQDNRYADRLDLKHGFNEKLKTVYSGFGIDLDKFNGNSKWELPIPARFVVAGDGVIHAADFNADYTVRPEPTATVEILRSLVS